MEFCRECDNMLYTKINSEESPEELKGLVYYCLNCNKYYDNIKPSDNCVFELDFNMDNIRKESCINKYTTEDPTLPVAEGIKCPNADCPVKPPDTPRVVYINYDSVKMKYTYICLDCKKAGKDHTW